MPPRIETQSGQGNLLEATNPPESDQSTHPLTRREFLKLSALATGGLAAHRLLSRRTPVKEGSVPDEEYSFTGSEITTIIDQLDVDSQSVIVREVRTKKDKRTLFSRLLDGTDTTSYYEVSFVARDTSTLASEYQSPAGARIKISFDPLDDTWADNKRTKKTAQAVASMISNISTAKDDANRMLLNSGMLGIGLSVDGIKSKWSSLSSRQKILLTAGGTLVVGRIIAACNRFRSAQRAFDQATSTPEGQIAVTQIGNITLEPVQTPTPQSGPAATVEAKIVPEKTYFAATDINVSYLKAQSEIITNLVKNTALDQIPQPTSVPATPIPVKPEETPTPVPTVEGENETKKDVQYTSDHWGIRNLQFANSRIYDGPLVDAVRLAVAMNTKRGINQQILTYDEGQNGSELLFENLTLYSEQLDFSDHPDWQGEYVVLDGWPQRLVLKDGSRITVVGRHQDGDQKQIVIAYEEHEPRADGTTFHEPRIRFAVIDSQEFGIISKELLLNMEYIIGEEKFAFTETRSGQSIRREVELNNIDDPVFQRILEETKGYWKEKYSDPKSESKFTPFPKPIVPIIPPDLIPAGINENDLIIQWWENQDLIGSPEAVRLYVRDPNTKYIVLVAKYDNTTREWGWRETTLRDKIDLFGKELGAVSGIDYLQSWQPESVRMRPLFEYGFNLFVSDYEALWRNPGNPGMSLRPSKDDFYYGKLDQIVRFSSEIDAKTQVHHLLIGYREHLPQWLLDIEDEFKRNGTSLEDRKAILYPIVKNHIQTLMSRYRGRIQEWSVVNEFLGTPWWNNFWRDNLGTDPEWILKAFQWAQEADPDAILILNDGGFEYGPHSGHSSDRGPKILELAKYLHESGIPLTMGFQMHVKASDFTGAKFRSNFDKLRQNIQSYINIGVPVFVTELDVDLHGVGGTEEERYELQANIYREIFSTCFELGVKSISVFQFPDRLNWLEGEGSGGGKDSDPTMFYDNYQPKPALIAVEGLINELLINTS